ncbi:MAG: hypothetical protein MJ237_08250 [bacterium]|nr:hypothetical protein [bacterium]
MANFLKISLIEDSTVKKYAKQANNETLDNDTIDTQRENDTFTNLIIKAFSKGEITTNTAKKYINASNSVFIQNNEIRKAEVGAIIEGIELNDNCRLYRKINSERVEYGIYEKQYEARSKAIKDIREKLETKYNEKIKNGVEQNKAFDELWDELIKYCNSTTPMKDPEMYQHLKGFF